MKSIGTSLLKVLKFVLPILLLWTILLPIYGWVVPWPEGKDHLAPYEGKIQILVDTSYRSLDVSGETVSRSWSRSYVFLPSTLSDVGAVTFSQSNDGPVLISHSRLKLAWLIMGFVLYGLGTWWFWFRRVPPNNSFKPKPLRGSA